MSLHRKSDHTPDRSVNTPSINYIIDDEVTVHTKKLLKKKKKKQVSTQVFTTQLVYTLNSQGNHCLCSPFAYLSSSQMHRSAVIILIILLCSLFVNKADAGLVAYGICQAGCAALVVACYAGAGVVFGTVTAG